jgi:two-component sensor histidine kinase
VQKRVQALARAHKLLSQRGWHQIPLREVIETQIELYGAKRITLEGPDILLAPHAVQPLALFIHELAVNAAVHGALSRATGRIDITWQRTLGDNGISLEWSEMGGPVPRSDRRRGFGTVIADATIERQLLGTTDRTWSDEGLKVSVHVPNVVG